jgi:hypothetical protein
MIRLRLFFGLLVLAFIALVCPNTVCKALEKRWRE